GLGEFSGAVSEKQECGRSGDDQKNHWRNNPFLWPAYESRKRLVSGFSFRAWRRNVTGSGLISRFPNSHRRKQQSIAAFGNRLNVFGVFRVVAKGLAQFADCNPQPTVEINKSVIRPDVPLNLIPRNHLSGVP